ncbi:TPA: PQQ-binding-like beta-propeller repeat protein [Candidatus Woesearchaeota archaeon]|nr:PQQ-binding-like beta-propeller repeat protein [Candidatus Woesearchaeota archaeon]HIH39838.1 PQQ-binding-like beta-propeller repeat protein [Candidatus Woesearchaeota archaeon]
MKKIILLLILAVFITGCNKEIENTAKKLLPSAISKEEKIEVTSPTAQNEIINESEEKPIGIIEQEPIIEKTNWPTFHGNTARTGYSHSKSPSTPNSLWKYTVSGFTGKEIDSLDANWPIIDDNKVFLAISKIFAIELKTGKDLWSFGEKTNFYARGLVVGNEKLFATVNDNDNLKSISAGFVYALDKNTGKFLWKYQTEKGISHSLPLFAGSKVFVGDDSGKIYALDSATGSLIWKKQLDAEVIHSSPSFDNNAIFVGTEGSQKSNSLPSYLYALNASDGSELWKFKIDYLTGKLNLVHSTPAILDSVVYFGAENGYFYALSSKDGNLIWKEIIASGSEELVGVSSAAALGYGKIFIGTYEGNFFALNQKDGKVVWEYNFGKSNADSSPVLADNKVYFGVGEGGDGYFYSFNANNGEVIWKEKLGGSSGALAEGILIVQNKLAEEELKPETPVIIAFSDKGSVTK